MLFRYPYLSNLDSLNVLLPFKKNVKKKTNKKLNLLFEQHLNLDLIFNENERRVKGVKHCVFKISLKNNLKKC